MQRPGTVRLDASSVQGEGAYILWKRLTWGERKAIQQAARDGNYEPIAMLLQHIVEWNWVDSEGKPLPIPTCEADYDNLYDEEIAYLANVGLKAVQGRLELTLEAEKN